MRTLVILGGEVVLAVGICGADYYHHRLQVQQLPPIRVLYPRSVGDLIVLESLRLGLPPHIALATAQRESKMTPHLVSPPDKDGGRNFGVMQLHQCAHLRVGCWMWSYGQLHDTMQNIDAGIEYLVRLRGYCKGNERCIHHAYLTGRIVTSY